MPRFAVLFFAVTAITGCSPAAPSALERLHPCTHGQGPSDAYCGKLAVYEDRARGSGRMIDLKIVVLPALRRDAKPDPVFVFAGGPGQGAAALAPTLSGPFRRFQTDRDIVMIDQRGTGGSHPLNCRPPAHDSDDLAKLSDESVERFRECLRHYDADPALYTTSVAMDDIDDVRAFLGYREINLWGASYGTRAALAYLRQYPTRVRSVILDGVVPPDMLLPLTFARDGQRALEAAFDSCDKDAACHVAHPALKSKFDQALDRLSDSPKVKLVHPRTGERAEVPLSRDVAAAIVMGALYSPLTASVLPRVIEAAAAGDYQGLVTLGLSRGGAGDEISEGMFLSVICSEDVPRIRPDEVHQWTKDTFLRDGYFKTATKPCAFWPAQTIAPSNGAPVVSNKPVLLLSGELDPVTPPARAESATKYLQNAKHIVVPATGHGASFVGCVPNLMAQFLNEASVATLNSECVQKLKRPPFFLGLAGPTGLETRTGGSKP